MTTTRGKSENVKVSSSHLLKTILRRKVQMNNKVNPSSAEVISDNTLVEAGQEPAIGDLPIVREEEWDLCQEVLDRFGSEQLLFQKEVENIQREEERKKEEKGRKERKRRERKTVIICSISPIIVMVLLFLFFKYVI